MFSKTLIAALTVGLAAFSAASPIEKVRMAFPYLDTLLTFNSELLQSPLIPEPQTSHQQLRLSPSRKYRPNFDRLLSDFGHSFPDDVGGKADAAGAVADVVNKVVQLVQGLIDGDIKVKELPCNKHVDLLTERSASSALHPRNRRSRLCTIPWKDSCYEQRRLHSQLHPRCALIHQLQG